MQERADLNSDDPPEGGSTHDEAGNTSSQDQQPTPVVADDLPEVRQRQGARVVSARPGRSDADEAGDSAGPDVQAARSGAQLRSRYADEDDDPQDFDGEIERRDEGDDDEVVEGELTDGANAQQALVTLVAAALSRTSSWSGLLPPPDEFAKYPPDVQQRMMAWNDADTVDESKRQDRLVDAEIDQAKVGRWIALGLTLFCFVAAAVFFALGNEIAGGAFLAAPVLTAIGRFFVGVFSRSSREATQPPATPPARPELETDNEKEGKDESTG